MKSLLLLIFINLIFISSLEKLSAAVLTITSSLEIQLLCKVEFTINSDAEEWSDNETLKKIDRLSFQSKLIYLDVKNKFLGNAPYKFYKKYNNEELKTIQQNFFLDKNLITTQNQFSHKLNLLDGTYLELLFKEKSKDFSKGQIFKCTKWDKKTILD